jgi:phosphatidylinositol dimannoside acyltransferase
MSARNKLIVGAYKAGARVASALPESTLPFLGKVGGRIGGWPQRGNRKMAARHQQRASRRTDPKVVDEVFECYGRYWLEMLRMPTEVRRGAIAEHFDIKGHEMVLAALERGKGAIYALPHLGGWEWGAAWMAEQGHHMLAVVEALQPPELFEWFLRQREAMGLEIAALGPDVSSRVLGALRDNRIVCLVADRDLTGDGVDVEFFGERTTLPAGPATLALRTGAALFPACIYFGPGREHHAVVRPELDVSRQGRLREDIARITQDLAHEFEDLIRAAPEQWHLLQPNWPSDRE